MIDMTGLKFDRLLVIQKSDINKHKEVWWICKCDCGNFIVASGYALRHNKTKSCGCNKREKISIANSKHGHSKDRLYKIWTDMRRRCLKKNATAWEVSCLLNISMMASDIAR